MTAATLLWLRRDLRLADHPALVASIGDGGPVVPVFVLDPETEATGAAAKWRLGRSIADFAERLAARGSRLVLRRGPALATLRDLAAEVGARRVRWSRLYAPDWVERDRAVKAGLRAAGLEAESHPGFLLRDPWAATTGSGAGYKVFGAFWRAIAPLDVPEPLREPDRLPAPQAWPRSDRLEEWRLGAAMQRGAAVVGRHAAVGEAAALARLDTFLGERLGAYAADRDRPDREGTSRLSENLAYGEISPARVWRGAAAAREAGAPGAEAFLRELGWREFAWHLMWHAPQIGRANWRPDWDAFPWRGDNPDAERWRRGLTGEPFVDAGMREMFVTGTMHNRVRMVVASYLTKHLMTHWRVGQDWFAECLIDWDPASNALGWQWTAGSGPDAAPFFRVFNPALQAERYDPRGAYRRRFLLGFDGSDEPDAMAFHAAAPLFWGLAPDDPAPEPLVDLGAGRAAALAAYSRAMGRG